LKRGNKPGAIQWAQAKPAPSKDAEKSKTEGTNADKKNTQVVMVDRERTDRLNGLLREKRRGARIDMRQLKASDRRIASLNNWRERQRRGVRLQANVARRMAEMELRREEKLRDLERSNRKFSFADRRRQQLDQWRNRGQLVTGGLAGGR